ncbi:hypothetical protein J6590_011688 [Homalodisca vitripennis]|nr:hypothetical protein J6590_011688 [Homalodisca vitripennis]
MSKLSTMMDGQVRERRETLIKFTFLLVQRLESDAVTDLTTGIWSHFRLTRYKKVGGDEEAKNKLSTSFRHQRRLDYKV